MSNKLIAMIPVRMGSKRVPKKNIRMLGDKPLVGWIIEAARDSCVFDEIYLNSEDHIFKSIAEQYGIKFYDRPDTLARDETTNDDFAYSFLKDVECDTMVQLLATSPFITPKDIVEFVTMMERGKFDTLISVKEVQIECVKSRGFGSYEDGINFDKNAKTLPSQELDPVWAYACGIMGWKREKFIETYATDDGAYHGSNGKTGYFILKADSVIDIDSEQDFELAELLIQHRKNQADNNLVPTYYSTGQQASSLNDNKIVSGFIGTPAGIQEADVEKILKKDGIDNIVLHNSNHRARSLHTVINNMTHTNDGSWAFRVIDTESNCATLICQQPGQSNRMHFHPDWNEWWLIIQGKWKVELDGEAFEVESFDIVFLPKGKKHRITALEVDSVRLAISRADVIHEYEK